VDLCVSSGFQTTPVFPSSHTLIEGVECVHQSRSESIIDEVSQDGKNAPMYRKAVSTLLLLAYLDDHVHCVFDWSRTHFDRASVPQVYCQFLFEYEVYKLLRKFVFVTCCAATRNTYYTSVDSAPYIASFNLSQFMLHDFIIYVPLFFFCFQFTHTHDHFLH